MKIIHSLFSFLILFSYIFSENSTNITDNSTDGINFSFDIDPFKDFDFGNIIWLDDSNATSEIKKHDLIYVLFYTLICEPCYEFLPIIVNTSKYAEENNLKIKFAKIEGMSNPNISEEFRLSHFPSLYLCYNGSKVLYEGKRTQEGVLKFLDRKLNHDKVILQTLTEIKEYVASSILTILCTIKSKSHPLYDSFINNAKMRNNMDFIACTSDECIKEYGENIVIFKEFDEKINIFTKEMGPIENATSSSFSEFLATYGVEAGVLLSPYEINMMFENRRNMVIFFRNSSNDNITKYDSVIKEIGLELRNKKIYALTADVQGDPIHEHLANSFMVLPIDLPELLFYDENINPKMGDLPHLYILRNLKEEEINKEHLLDFINKVIEGKARKTLYSQPPQESYNQDGLRIVIGRTFDSDVIDNKNNVLLALINGAVQSDATDNVLSIMRKLSKKYNEEEDKILFAYSDAQVNEPRDVELAGHVPPIVLLYTNAMEEKKKIELENKNFTTITEEEIENFLMENLKWDKKKEYKEKKVNEKTEKKEEKIENNKSEMKEEKDKNEKKTEDDNKPHTDL